MFEFLIIKSTNVYQICNWPALNAVDQGIDLIRLKSSASVARMTEDGPNKRTLLLGSRVF